MDAERSLWSRVRPVRVRSSPETSENAPTGLMDVL